MRKNFPNRIREAQYRKYVTIMYTTAPRVTKQSSGCVLRKWR